MDKEHSEKIICSNEKKTLLVIILTAVTMSAEIIYGYITNSMALSADGWHMGTHALALSLTYTAYILIRKFKDSPKFPCGTDKIGTLTAYTSAVFLGITGVWIILEAIERIINPLSISFNNALIVAVIGLAVNAACIFIMETPHLHKTCSENEKKHKENQKEDYNFKSAYYHILTDALTSFLAIAALLTGKYLNLTCFDALAGILGGILILKWSAGLLKHTAVILIDMKQDKE